MKLVELWLWTKKSSVCTDLKTANVSVNQSLKVLITAFQWFFFSKIEKKLRPDLISIWKYRPQRNLMKLGSHFNKQISIWVHFVKLNSFIFFSFSVLSAMIRGAHDGKQFVCTDYEEKDLDEVFESFFKIEWLIFIKQIEWIKRNYIFVSYVSTCFISLFSFSFFFWLNTKICTKYPVG